ncbi:MAG: VCBS repeat-containing protein [Alphaproteobacteria bacterium]|nr:VCBS repeat-containing protein [Alphaproteobacteria bacterium]
MLARSARRGSPTAARVAPCASDPGAVDWDRDGICDDVELCFGDDATDDSDGDGVCDSDDTVALWPAVDVGSIADPDLGMGVLLVDTDADGDLDILWYTNANAVLSDGLLLAENTGDGFAAPVAVGPVIPSGSPTLAVGDLNHDGLPDLAITTTFDLFYLLATAPNEWPELERLSDGADSIAFAVVDLAGDGFPEIVLGHAGGLSIADNPDGTPLPPTLLADDFGANQLQVLDANGNPWPDLLLPSEQGTFLFTDPGLPSWTRTQVGSGAIDAALFDMDLDGDLDLATVVLPRTLQIADDDGGLPATPVPIPTGQRFLLFVESGQLDGDSWPDVLLGGTNALLVHGSEVGLVPTHTVVAQGNHALIALGDVDGDGDQDALVTRTFKDVRVLLNPTVACTGDPTTFDHDHDGVCGDQDLCDGDDSTGDTDGDGLCDDLDTCPAGPDADADQRCDAVDACFGEDSTGDADRDGVCDDLDPCYGDQDLGDADGDGVCDDRDKEDLWDAQTVGGTLLFWGAEVRDADGDGDMDILAAQADGVHVLLGDHGTFTDSGFLGTLPAGTTRAYVDLGDVDGDTVPDLVLVHDTAVEVFPGQGDGVFGARQTLHDFATFPGFGPRPLRLLVADVHGDGFPEIIVTGSSYVFLLDNDGGTFTPSRFQGASHVPGLADTDGDGDLDLVTVWENLVVTFPDAVLADPQRLATGRAWTSTDLDADAAADLAFGTVSLGWRSGMEGSNVRLLSRTQLYDLASAQLDTDDAPDLLAATSHGILVVRGSRGGPRPAHRRISSDTSYLRAIPADLDGDGDTDVLGITAAGSMHVLLDPRNPRWASASLGPVGDAATLADADGDGDPDVLVASDAGWPSRATCTACSCPPVA